MPDFKKMWEEGFPAFKQLFEMSPNELKEKLHSICGEKYKELIDNAEIKWESQTFAEYPNEKTPTEISLWYYDSLSITPFGINYKLEHGDGKKLVEFNKHFKL